MSRGTWTALAVAVALMSACDSPGGETSDPPTTAGATSTTEPVSTHAWELDLDGVESFTIAEATIAEADSDYGLLVRQLGGEPDHVAELRGSDEFLPSAYEFDPDRLVLAGDVCPLRDCEPPLFHVVLIDFRSGAPSVDSLATFDPPGFVTAVHGFGDEVIVAANENGTTSIVAIDTNTGARRTFDWAPEPHDAAAIRRQAAESPEAVIDVPRAKYCAADDTLWAVTSPGLGLDDHPMSMSGVSIDLATGRATGRGQLRDHDVRAFDDIACTASETSLSGPGVEDVSFSID